MTRILIRAGKSPVHTLMYAFEPPLRESRGQESLDERVTRLEQELKVQQNVLASWRGQMSRVLRINQSAVGARR